MLGHNACLHNAPYACLGYTSAEKSHCHVFNQTQAHILYYPAYNALS